MEHANRCGSVPVANHDLLEHEHTHQEEGRSLLSPESGSLGYNLHWRQDSLFG